MAVKTYNPAEVLIIVAGIPITGFADGTFLKVARDNPSYKKVVGSSGEVTRTRTNDNTAKATLTLLQTSASNDLLSALSTTDEATGDGVGPFLVKDGSGRTLLASASCWIEKPSDVEFGSEISNREWVIDLESVTGLIGGN